MRKTSLILLSAAIIIFNLAGCAAKEDIIADANEPASTASESVSAESEPVSESEAAEDSQSEAADPVIPEEPPNNSWEFDAPENHGVDGEMLGKLHDAIEETEIYSFVIAKDGYIISEYYKEGYDPQSVFRLNSCTKSFSGALIGIAIDEGLIDGVDTKISEFFPQLAESDDEYKREITVRHLLEHTSGIDWPEWGAGTMFVQFASSEDWVDFVLSRPMAAKPGTTFNYTTGGSHLLSAIIQQATGKNANAFGREHLFKPLGMDSVKWRVDPQGITDGGNGISMNALDAAKFGQLYLDNGKWKDQQIIPEAWVEESTSYQSAGSYGTGEYGYQWWLKEFGENGAYRAYYAMGYAGQYIFVVPELELVTVITSRFTRDTYAPQAYFANYVLPACG